MHYHTVQNSPPQRRKTQIWVTTKTKECHTRDLNWDIWNLMLVQSQTVHLDITKHWFKNGKPSYHWRCGLQDPRNIYQGRTWDLESQDDHDFYQNPGIHQQTIGRADACNQTPSITETTRHPETAPGELWLNWMKVLENDLIKEHTLRSQHGRKLWIHPGRA